MPLDAALTQSYCKAIWGRDKRIFLIDSGIFEQLDPLRDWSTRNTSMSKLMGPILEIYQLYENLCAC